jgi:AraC family transcriptional regulator of adaptative response/methylated-DNA-[protein]-cysteine methyltransferase
MTPATYAKGGKGAVIGYTAVDCALGRLMVAATETGICMVCLGDDDASLQRELVEVFPAATLVRDEIVLDRWVKALIAVIDGSEPHPGLPLDIRGTAFQWRVWQELMAIPAGETRTYKEIAERIGNPKAVRAVGRACATNPVALTIPCHRAIRADGSLSGYRWGLTRKQALLETEKAAVEGD